MKPQARICQAAAMLASLFWLPSVHAAAVTGQGTWETTLQARDLDGNGVTDAFYDTSLDITWARQVSPVNGQWLFASNDARWGV